MRNLAIFVIIIFIKLLNAYSYHYKKCRLDNKRDISNITFERVIYPKDVYTHYQPVTHRPLDLVSINNLINYKFIDSGGSGQIFLMQDLNTSQFKILKRYFNVGRFEQQNYVMHKMNYDIQWAMDPLYGNYISLFPYTQSKPLNIITISKREAYIIMYKTILELQKAHQYGFFHMDIKPANILLDAVSRNNQLVYGTAKCRVSLIDWNLVNFYYKGAEYLFRRGTACYFAPQLIIWSKFYTPAVDIWSLGITFYFLLTDHQPLTNCKKESVGSMIQFVGYNSFIQFFHKYRAEFNLQQLNAIQKWKNHQGTFKLETQNLKNQGKLLQIQVNLLNKMLQVDPEKRSSLKQLLNHSIFQRIRNLPPPYQQKDKKKHDQEKQTNQI